MARRAESLHASFYERPPRLGQIVRGTGRFSKSKPKTCMPILPSLTRELGLLAKPRMARCQSLNTSSRLPA